MMKMNSVFNVLGIVATLWSSILLSGVPQILKSDASGITVSFEVEEWQVSSVSSEGHSFVQLDFFGKQVIEEPGKPAIPYHTATIGIPIGAKISARIVRIESETLSNAKLIPHSTYRFSESISKSERIPDNSIYQKSAAFPQNLMEVSEPGWFRDQQVIDLRVAAAKYEPGSNSIEKLNKVIVRIDFEGGSRVEFTSARSANEERWRRSAILNYEDAIKWQKPRKSQTSLAKNNVRESMFYTFEITEDGIYKIDGALLESKVSGLNLQDINPDKIRLYNNGGQEIARNLLDERPDGLLENAIIVNDGGDGRFDKDDFILFYAIGVEGWNYDPIAGKFEHYRNRYVDANRYWLTLEGGQNGKRMESVASSQTQQNVTQTYNGLYFIEEEQSNPVRSGMNWFGRQFTIGDNSSGIFQWTADLPNAQDAGNATFRFRFFAVNEGSHRFDLTVNTNTWPRHAFTGIAPIDHQYHNYRKSDLTFNDNFLESGENRFQLLYSHSSSGAAYLDWVELSYAASMNAVDDKLLFHIIPQSITESYRISGFSNDKLRLFDVTDFSEVMEITDFSSQNNALTFTATNSALNEAKRYVAISESKIKSVSNLTRASCKNLRDPNLAAEFVIITHDNFESEALRLESFRENGSPNNRLSTVTVKISDIYNNFSSGMMDAVAIRDFLHFAYNNWSPKPLYVLLIGDGNYDYKNKLATEENWIPAYQTDAIYDDGESSIAVLRSRTMDAALTYLTEDDYIEGRNIKSSRRMDLSIGRINARSISDAQNVIDKIIEYESSNSGSWKNTITIIGDDELVGGGAPNASDDIHIKQAEKLAESNGRYIPNSFNRKKIYLSEYPKALSGASSGITKPAAKADLIEQINQGSLIINFIGHGNSTLWAHEAIFQQSDNELVQNSGRPAFFIAATCDWALHDDPTRQSQAEELLLAKDKGAIAIFSSSRLVFARSNAAFSQNYYEELFSDKRMSIGDAFVLARARGGTNLINDEKYHIYGDPTLKLGRPQRKANIVSFTPDSIVALSKMSVEAQVLDENDAFDPGFNGTALVNVFDSRKAVTNIPEAGSAQNYLLPGNTIFRGFAPVSNGKFKVEFIVPKDISYGGQLARVSVYFWDQDEKVDGSGYLDNILVSSSSAQLVDTEGPEITFSFKENPNFSSGDIVGDNTTLIIELEDTVSGINIAGGIGHKLTLEIDPDDETCLSEFNRINGVSAIDLTELFRFNEGEYLRGKIEYPIAFPEKVEIAGQSVSCAPLGGKQKHTLRVKAWDNSNNSAVAQTEVRITHKSGLILEDVLNYPNPFREQTTFTFFLNEDANVRIKIFTISGKLIQTLEYPDGINGFNMIEWDGRDRDGDIPANGIYLYKLIAKSNGLSSNQTETIGRLVIMR